MIRIEELGEFRPTIRFKNGEGVTLQTIQVAIQKCAKEREIPVAFYESEVKSGGLFSSSLENCIVMYHPSHPGDYFQFCIRVKYQGAYAFVTINDYGESIQGSKAATADFMRQDRQGKPLSYMFGSVVGGMFRTRGLDRQKLEEEQMYYQCVNDIFDDVLG